MKILRLGARDYPTLAAAIHELVGPGSATEAHLSAALADGNSYFIVCLLDSAPVGYLSAYRFPAVDRDGFYVYLYDIVVHERRRRHGIASAMIEVLKTCCRQDAVTRIWVGTSTDNRPAQRTFEATGARRESETYIEFIYPLDRPDRQR